MGNWTYINKLSLVTRIENPMNYSLKLKLLITFTSLLLNCHKANTQHPVTRTIIVNSVQPTIDAGVLTRDASIIEIDSSITTSPTIAAAPCPNGTVLVEGEYCPNVEQNCIRWADDFAGNQQELRCLEFAPSRCLSRRRVPMRFCMDIYEAPNTRGTNPIVMVDWYQAQRACAAQGKRLCTSNEWEFACEGPNMNPYPYGLSRDSTACRIDHQTVRYDPQRLANPLTRDDEVRRVYEAVPSGSLERCVSWAGIHDMTGNVDEWVANSHSRNMDHPPYHSGLKGGWWGPIRARCRPMTTIHSPTFVYYQISYRCCQNPR